MKDRLPRGPVPSRAPGLVAEETVPPSPVARRDRDRPAEMEGTRTTHTWATGIGGKVGPLGAYPQRH